MPIGSLHCVENGIYEGLRNLLLKEIAHGVCEYTLGLPPTKRLPQPLGPGRQIEPMLKRMPRDPPKAFGSA